MRDDSQLYDLYEVEDSTRPSRLAAALAATAAVALLAGVVTWTYRLGVRDANDIPVIRAAEGPARIRPEDPGGAQFKHQGRAVYAAIADAPPAPAETALAPGPEALAAEDAAAAALTGDAGALPQAPADEVDLLVAAVLGEVSSAQPAAAPTPAASAPRSPAPAPRPTTPRPAAAAPDAAPVAVAAAGGGALIQLGAYLSEADARRMWVGLKARNSDVLGGSDPVVSPTSGGARVLHRLRAGPFADAAEARRLCGLLQSRGVDCLVSGLN